MKEISIASFPMHVSTCQLAYRFHDSFPWYAILIVALGGTSILLIFAAFFVLRLAPAMEKLRFHLVKKNPPGVQIQIYRL